ncbi:Protein N-acetyltransferase, RimJ/RimL family [Butyrivibrio proteoclasticus]|uniref:Protein N-acetyltransferase, RimJ/RimL family n=1 Tax=Butyrivibrio proteoclasticus TaxID=43305 RepID=A0A1I5PIY1_9FIRM|nr:GNAT family protein [Butyrivibrio proteoclasticus]SFP34072.1 Protein N-acetyltransferase, RimJ/RimL family [Butyrivibrio proteoclasticus]
MLLVGENVALRLMTKDDTDLIVKWRNNKRVRNNFVYRETFSREIHENWIKTKVETGEVVQLIICEKNNNNRPVGSVYFRDIDNDAHSAEYGIFIGEDDAIGKGYGNETAVLATGYARQELGLTKLILRVFTYNEAAIKSYEYAGFVKVEDLPMVECSDGEKSDMILMEQKI